MQNHERIMRALLWSAATTMALACGSSGDTSDAGADGGSEAATISDAANDVSDAPACSVATFAMTKQVLGDGSSGQWMSLGFNIDGLVSTAASTDVCQPNSGGDVATAYPDGDNGIDNSWGKNIVPLIVGVYPTWSSDTNAAIQSGAFSSLYEMSCLTPKGDVPSFSTKQFLATSLGSTPLLDGTDQWPVAPELLTSAADPDSSMITFPASSITGSLFDTKANQTFAIRFPIASKSGSTMINLTLHAAHVQMTLSADRKSATGGVIGGVIKTEDFVTEVKKIGYLFNLCGQSVLTSLITAVRQASDIMSDGTQNPSSTCDGISIGLGFEAAQAKRGAVGPAEQTAPTCP
jgi:hypothetical protein